MLSLIVKNQVRQGFANLSRGNFNAIVNQMSPDVHFSFAGSHALGGEFHQRTTVHQWFERVHRLFPGLTITSDHIIVSGWPWDIRAVTQFSIQDTLPDGQLYENQGIQILRIRFGKIIEDHLIEDTQRLINTLQYLAELGVAEALSPVLVN